MSTDRRSLASYSYAPQFLRAFSRPTCEKICSLAIGRPRRAEILTPDSIDLLDRRARTVSLFRIKRTRASEWLFYRLETVVSKANADAWSVQFERIFEPLSL